MDNCEAALRREVDLAVADEPEFTPSGTTSRKQVSLDEALRDLRPLPALEGLIRGAYSKDHSGVGEAGIKRHGTAW